MQRYRPERSTTIITPTYNERDNLQPLVERVFGALDPDQTELLIVDDDSPDGTADVGRALGATWPVRVLHRKDERGLATAVIEGLRQARGVWAACLDADLSHPPEALPALLKPLEDGDVDMVVGSRFVPGARVDLAWPWFRQLNSWGARWLARPLSPLRDVMSGFFALRRERIQFERLDPAGYKIALELLVRHDWRRVIEVPITFSDRLHGETKLSLGEQLRYLEHLRRLYGWRMRRSGRPLDADCGTADYAK